MWNLNESHKDRLLDHFVAAVSTGTPEKGLGSNPNVCTAPVGILEQDTRLLMTCI